MNPLQKFYYFFSTYTGPAERRVAKFFRRINENQSTSSLERSLLDLVQSNLATVNLWSERSYKGYHYLTKRMRRQLYQNLEAIKADFLDFQSQNPVDLHGVLEQIKLAGGAVKEFQTTQDQLAWMVSIMRYLAPRSGRYQYRRSSSFGRLLRNPQAEQMIGDCNQIVTLYIVLYALRYSVRDLRLTLIPGHVAIRFFGIDIETTSGSFKNYNEPNQMIAPIHEIVSVNLLDTTDTNYAQGKVPARTFLESARLAYVVSSNRTLVKRNLDISYQNTVREFIDQKNFKLAFDYAKQSKNFELIEMAAHNGAVYELRQKNYSRARKFAVQSRQRAELCRSIDEREAAELFNGQQYESARKIYQRLGEREMVKRCWRGLYAQEHKKLGKLKTTADVKANAGIIRNMERYAKASGDRKLIDGMRSLLKHL